MKELQAKLVADDFIFLEAPKWHQGKIWTSDVNDGIVYTVTLDGKREKVCDVPGKPAGLGFMPDGRLIIASLLDLKLLEWNGSELSLYRDLSDLPGPPNDFAIDDQGRIYLGNFGYNHFAGEAPRPTALVRIDPDKAITPIAGGVEFPNGAVILNGKTLVVNETWVGRITAFDLAKDGTLSNRRLWADMTGKGPDGMCADAEGAIWVGCYHTGEIVRVLDGGEITDRVKFDGCGISCTIGGPDNHTLFMTAFVGAESGVAQNMRHSGLFAASVAVGAPVNA
jgi:sugar lactone lactonase YvrE